MSTDYEAESDRVTTAFLASVIDCDAQWKLEKKTDGCIEIFSRDSSAMAGKMYKSEVWLDFPAEHVLAMVSPVMPYRPQWDSFLEKLEVVSKVSDKTYLVYHVVKPSFKGLIAARDSLDVVKFGAKDNYYYVSAGGVDNPEYPPMPKYVRSFQHPAGYIIFKDEQNANRCKFVMLFHVDINMNQVGSFMVNMVKPQLMGQKVNNLRQALKTIKPDQKHVTECMACTVPLTKQ